MEFSSSSLTAETIDFTIYSEVNFFMDVSSNFLISLIIIIEIKKILRIVDTANKDISKI